MTTDLVKRKFHYIHPPYNYEISRCSCGNDKTQWSEFVDHLWCDKCNKDFIPENWGFFDGPISLAVCSMFGISFDRIEIATGKRIKMILNEDTGEICKEWLEARP